MNSAQPKQFSLRFLAVLHLLLRRILEVFKRPDWLEQNSPSNLRKDLFAGLTGATLVLPQAVAFAAIAGLPPSYGFYTAMITPVVAAIFGSSWHAVSGPTTAISALVFGALAGLYPVGSVAFFQAAVTLALIVGVFQLLLGMAHLGALVSFVSHSVMVGFVSGAAFLIALSQIGHALHLDLPRPDHFIEFFQALSQQIADIDPASLGIALLSLIAAILVRVFLPSWPNYLLALMAGTAAYLLLGEMGHDVQTIGAVASIIPAFALPETSFGDLSALVSPALAIALVGLLEASAIARGIASRSGQDIDASREFTGQGMSNIIGSFFGCYPGSASFTRSGVNYEAGAATPLSAVFSAVFLFLILLFVAPYFAFVPIPAMAGVILLVAWRLIDLRAFLHLMQMSFAETMIAAGTLFAVLFVDLEFAIYVGVLSSTMLFMQRAANPRVSIGIPNASKQSRPFEALNDNPEAHCPQLFVAGVEGPMFFGSVDALRKEFRNLETEMRQQVHMLLIIKGTGSIDLPAAELLAEEAKRRKRRGGMLWLLTKNPVVHRQLDEFGVLEEMGGGSVFLHKGEALSETIKHLDRDTCQICPKNIFRECQGMKSNNE